jgi:hypothetical protein
MLRSPRVALALGLVGLFGLRIAFGVEENPVPDPFRQLTETLPTTNTYRTASGAPGHEYWQQRADYVIAVELDDERQHVTGHETITYSNHSPDRLAYLWVQLDANLFSPESHAVLTSISPEMDNSSFESVRRSLERRKFDGGSKVTAVKDATGAPLEHVVVDTMMRIDLPRPLEPGAQVAFSIDWNYAVNNSKEYGGRTGYERFEKDGNVIYEIAQWFPRMAAYTDVDGWQHKQFLGGGEFTLEFGDYVVASPCPTTTSSPRPAHCRTPSRCSARRSANGLVQARARRRLFSSSRLTRPRPTSRGKPEGKRRGCSAPTTCATSPGPVSRKFIWDALRHEVEGNRCGR